MKALQNWWSTRLPRERSILAFGAIAVALLLGYWFAWQPASRGITQLQGELPVLQRQNAEVAAMAAEAKRLRGQGGGSVALPPGERLAAVRNSLERAGLAGETNADGDTRVRVRVADVDYAIWAAWLAAAETELGVRTMRANVTALNDPDAAGRVKVDLVLEFGKGGG